MKIEEPQMFFRWYTSSYWHAGEVTAQKDHVGIDVKQNSNHDVFGLTFSGGCDRADEYLNNLRVVVETMQAAIDKARELKNK
jgi:hypothetical protein